MHDIGAGFTLLTRIPMPWVINADNAPDLKRSLWTYPLVGAVVSGLGAVVLYLVSTVGLPMIIAVLLAMTTTILLTGAFHEDGLADMADGLGGGQTIERKLEIMRDSRLGTYGATALVLSLALKASLLVSMDLKMALLGLVVTGALSRMGIVVLLRLLPPARPESLASVAGRASPFQLAIAMTFGCGLALYLVGPAAGALLIAASLFGSSLIGAIASRQVGGFTGDVLGASQQVSEITGLICLLVLATAASS